MSWVRGDLTGQGLLQYDACKGGGRIVFQDRWDNIDRDKWDWGRVVVFVPALLLLNKCG